MTFLNRQPGPAPWYWFLLFAALFSLQVVPRLAGDSPVGDEMGDIVNGFYYWQGDVLSDARHPPLPKSLQALPLRALGLKSVAHAHFVNSERRAYNFLFVLNRDRCVEAVAWARAVTLAFGLGVGLLLFINARGESRFFLFTVLTLWAFEPNLLAFSGFSLADMPVTFFLLASVLCLRWLLAKPGWGRSLLTGLLAAMSVTSKFSALVLVPIFLALELINWRAGGEKGKGAYLLALGLRWLVGLAGALCWVFLLYLPGTIFIPGHVSPFHYFWDGFWGIASLSGYPTYFLGQLSRQNHLLYFPLALLLKSPPALLLLSILAMVLAALGRVKIPAWHWLPPLAFFLAVMPFADIGIREVLPVFPFLILVAARGAQWLWQWPRGGPAARIAVAAVLAFQILNVGMAFPGHLSYFNPLVGEKQKLYYLGDSNLDVGQDAKRLAEAAARKGWKHVKLAYFGSTDPSFYGMAWSPWTQKDLKGPQPGWVYAVNAYYLQVGPAFMPGAQAILGSWITHTPETLKVGDTWYCYEFPGEPAPDSSPPLPSAPPFKYFENLGRESPSDKTQ